MNPTPSDRSRRRTRPMARAVALLAPFALVAAACGGDDDDATDDTTTTDVVDDTTSTEAMDDTTTTEAMDDTSTTEATEDTTGTSEPDSEAADVLTETLAGESVDVFLTLLPLVGFDEVTEADQITIFAPSDEAFTSIAADELASIVDDPERVVEVLQAHVVEGLVTASDLEEMTSVQPIRGEEVPVSVDGETIMVGDATVVETGIEFDGGIVHVIDDVLLLEEL